MQKARSKPAGPAAAPPPATREELLARAADLEGRSLREISLAQDVRLPTLTGGGTRQKGKPGALIELVLGATGGSVARHDFPNLEVELKTLPIDERGQPLESTYVCRVPAGDAERVEWATSWARAKLSTVLFVPIHATSRRQPFSDRVVGRAFLWGPSPEQEAILKADFEDIMGAIALGGAETLTAHTGRVLQARPKAAHGGVRMKLRGPDGESIETVPRGFYLRPAFTASLLRASQT